MPLNGALGAASEGLYESWMWGVFLVLKIVFGLFIISQRVKFLISCGDCSGDYGPDMTVEKLKDFHRRRLAVLSDAGPDLLALETIPCKLETQVHLLFLLWSIWWVSPSSSFTIAEWAVILKYFNGIFILWSCFVNQNITQNCCIEVSVLMNYSKTLTILWRDSFHSGHTNLLI